MALNLDAIGEKIGPIEKEYSWRDVVLYALGVGAGFDELEYVYEKDLKVIPTFSIATIIDFLFELGAKANVNTAGILHGEQEIVFHRPIPTEGKFITTGHIKNYYDLGDKGAIIVGESITKDAKGKKLFTSTITIVGRLDGNFGGEKPPKKTIQFPDTDPDFVVEDCPSPDQPLIYRLSGDLFALHVDPKFARQVGFKEPIMHGLCTLGFACRALIKTLVPGRPDKVRRISCRFSKPLYPGTPIKTLIWKVSDDKALYRVVNAKTGDVILDMGEFEFGELVRERIDFTGKVAVVTGAGGGLGRAYAIELAKRGAKVIVNDLGGSRDGTGASKTPAQKVVDEIKAIGGEAYANYDNVATKEGGENIIKTAIERFGRIDILINNAGILRDKSFTKMDPDMWHGVMDVHLHGAYYVTRPAFLKMKEQGYGRIIFTTSAAGLYGNFGQANYSAAKLALVGFMNTLKEEGEKYNIKVNTVAPLAVSRLTQDIFPEDMLDKAKPEYVVPLVLYLVSDKCDISGRIYNAGVGSYNRVVIGTGPGIMLSEKGEVPSPEKIKENLDYICSLKDFKVYKNLTEQLTDLLSSLNKKPDQDAKGESTIFNSPNEVFAAMPKAFKKDASKGVDVSFLFKISGKSGGEWVVKISNGNLDITEGVIDNPTTTLEMEDKDFLDMMNGKLPAMQAYTSGKLKISGDIMKSQLIEKLFKLN